MLKEPKADKDEEYRKKVEEYLNNPPTPGSSRGGGGGSLPTDLANLGMLHTGYTSTHLLCLAISHLHLLFFLNV